MKGRDLGKLGQDVIVNTVGEPLVLRTPALVLEGKHGNRVDLISIAGGSSCPPSAQPPAGGQQKNQADSSDGDFPDACGSTARGQG